MKTIQGKAASLGKVSGKVRIIRNYDNLNNVELGDIIVAECLHPDIAPVCLKIAGIIVQEASILQHACIIARELGIPCIVNVANCTEIFKDGEKVELDGAIGVIYRHEVK
jgi:pyruvate,water dikinase